MTLLEKCQKWHEAGQFPKIIEALEALGEDGRTPELASELARAYNNEADPNTSEGRLMLHRAIELLEPHEEALGATYLWNFRLGYAYYYLDQEGRALSRFRRAHEAKPEDKDAKEFMEDCLKRVTLPFFRVPFRERTQKAWTAFEGEEAEIRAMMDADKTHERGEEIVDRIERILRLAFEDVSFEVGFNGVKHELILTPEGNRMKLFELVYFRSHAPASVLRHWEITLGRRGTSGNELHAGGVRIGGEDVQAWLEPDDDAFKLSVFCARLSDLKAKEEGRAWWMLTTLTDQLLGEIPHMRWINDFELLDAPRAVPGFLLSDLPDKLRELGKDLALDAETLLEKSYVGYTREPDPDPDADWRLDVIAGSTACPPLINGYMSAEAVRTNPAEACLREWLRDKLKGELHASIFNERGADFACYYYGALHEYTPHYTMDVDIHAVSRIGVERNFSDEIQDEAYLFLPFDEDYYREMARIIERRYENWAGQRFDDSTLAPSETAEALMAYLDCECTYFPSMADDDPIMCAYEYAGKNAAHEGFVPMLIAVDETLWECLMLNSDPAHEGDDDHAFDPDAVAAYRQSQLAAPLPDGRMVLEDGMAERRAEAEDDSKDWDTEVVGRMEGGFNNHQFSGYWNSETDMTHPVILARIPVRHPWEVFAHLPFGNWNDCPDTPQLMAVARYWFEKFGAVPAVMTHDELDFALPKPIGRELAVQTALEQYAFCPDMDQNHESVGALADTLRQSKIWYFWWD